MIEHIKDPLAVELGRRGGLKGGKARALSLSGERREEIARNAALKRWGKPIKIYVPQYSRILICEGCRKQVDLWPDGWIGSGKSNVTVTKKGNPRMAVWCPTCYTVMRQKEGI